MTERLDRFQRKRTIEAQDAAARAANAAQVGSLETETRQPLWQRIFRRRATQARRVPQSYLLCSRTKETFTLTRKFFTLSFSTVA